MIESVLSNTKIVYCDSINAEVLNSLIIYLAGNDAKISIIQDNRPFELRDNIINDLKKYRLVSIKDKVFPDPKVSDIMDMVMEIKNEKPNLIIGIGGGSSLDSAKAVAAVLSNGGDLDDYLGPNPQRKIEKRDIKLILIPTTAGTGSEVTKFGVYTSRQGRKYTLASPYLQADCALLCLDFVKTLPPALTASTGFDALSHALETLWNKNATVVSDEVAINSACHILNWIETAYDSSLKGKIEGRKEMLIGATMAGISFNMTGTAAVHALSFILSEEWHIPHGTACAFTLENILKYNLKNIEARKKILRLSEKLFGKNDEEYLLNKIYDRIVELKKKMNLPVKFSDLNINIKENEIEKYFEKSFSDPKMLNNIVPAERKEIFDILKLKI